MNKKFSTLVASLLLAGGVLSPALADTLPLGEAAKKVEGKKYFLVQETGNTRYALAMDSYSEESQKVTYTYTNLNEDDKAIADAEISKYLWTVKEKQINDFDESAGYSVVFTNVATGKDMYVKNDGSDIQFSYKSEDLKNADNRFVWSNKSSYEEAVKGSEPSNQTALFAAKQGLDNEDWNSLYVTKDDDDKVTLEGDAANQHNFKLYEVDDQVVTDSELNELYNAQGFNLKFADDKYKDVENLLADTRLRAIDVEKFIQVGTDKNFGFPAGTYFVTETPGAVPSKIDADYLLNCTFVAVSSTENAATNADLQNAGEGFQLVTVKGKDLNLMKAGLNNDQLKNIDDAKKPYGADINVNNAAFTVKTNIVNNNGKYSLALANFFYKKTTDKADDMQSCTPIVMSVKSDKSYNSTEVLVSVQGSTPNFLFKFVESNVVKGTEFISADGKSVYNIYFPETETYLSSRMTSKGYQNYAVGEAMVEEGVPAFQYIVTNVNENDVTFMNRASQQSFTVKLFDEGEETYSLAENGKTTFTVLTFDNKGNIIEDADYTKVKINGQFVKLQKAETEAISGYDVEDGTQVTLTFARDNTPTSNKMYPVVKSDNLYYETLTDEIADAAQWQLVKSEDPVYRTITYAYLNDAEKVVFKTKGDTVAYYTYNLQYVEDGNAVADKFLQSSSQWYALGKQNTADDFKIKENVDGSVTMTTDGKNFLSVQYYDAEEKESIKEELNRCVFEQNINVLTKATDVKTYLVQEAPEVSLSADASYITLKSEKGNYITMNDEKDGIVVSAEELTFRVFATDLKAVVPSFFITTGWGEDHSRDLLFNPEDSVNYYVGAGKFDKEYQWNEGVKKAIFKNGILNETVDTLTTDIKGKVTNVAMKADNKGTKGGLNRFKFQIVLADDSEDLYVIRQIGASKNGETQYLSNLNDQLTWDAKNKALKFYIEETQAPTANEEVAVSEVSVVAVDGAVVVKGAAGKAVAISNILGQTIANTVIASDNETIAVPAGIVVVAVEGEEAVKAIVK